MSDFVRRLLKVGAALSDPLLSTVAGPRILIYHQVGAGSGRQMDVAVDVFAAHLGWLERHADVVSYEEALATPATDRLQVVLTFDDGYADVYQHAFPRLRERGMPFTLFLTTEPIESGVPLYGDGRSAPLGWWQVEEMMATGLVTVGVHTHRHPDLRLVSPAEIESDLAASDELVERRLGVRPRHFAYPWGYWSEAADPIVRERYDTAVLGRPGVVDAATDRYLIPRVPVQAADGVRFFAPRVKGGLMLEDRVRARVSGYRGP